MGTMRTVEIKMATSRMRSMMRSCYCYGGLEEGSDNFIRYIAKYKEDLGEQLFWRVYKREKSRLSKYEVEHGTYTSSDGGTYNSLKLKSDEK